MATLHDVAKAAGVSIATVSRALTTPSRVAEKTRRRIHAVAAELDYTPNRAASLLRSGRTGALGLIVPDLENPYFASLTKGAQQRALARGLTLLVADSEEDPDRERELSAVLSKQSDGIILCSPRVSDEELAGDGALASVLVNAEIAGIPSVTADFSDVTQQAIAHLHALGHRRIGYVGGPAASRSDAARRSGIELSKERLPDVEILDLGSFRAQLEGGEAAADLALGAGVTAVVAYNDMIALGLMAQLKKRGAGVPEDMSVVGCDDTFAATLAWPPLTTVRVDTRQLGATAVDVFLAANARRESQGESTEELLRRTLPVELVVRSSTAPAGFEQPKM